MESKMIAVLLVLALSWADDKADRALAGQVRKAQAQLDAGEARAALRTAERALDDAAAGSGSLPPPLRDALDRVVVGAHTALAGAPGEDPARRLDAAIAAYRGCVDRAGACGEPAPLAVALRARSGLLHRALLRNQPGASGAEARERCDQAGEIAPEPASDGRCLAVAALVADDPALALRAADLALSSPDARRQRATVDEAVSAAAQVIGYHHGRFDEALALVDRALAVGDAPACAALRPSLAQAIERLEPKRAAARADPTDADAARAWISSLEGAKLDRLAVSEARAALALDDPRLLEAAAVALFNAAARGKDRGDPPGLLRGWIDDAAGAFDRCAATLPRCAERAAAARAFADALR
jgi:hypothetical protein